MDDAQFSQDIIRQFLIDAHGNLDGVKATLAQHPALLHVAYAWSADDSETAIQAAAHMGNRPIAEYLLGLGAPLAIYTAAMLGRRDDVARILHDDPAQAGARGGHGISLLSHVAMSGNTDIAQMIYEAGAREGINSALFGAISFGHLDMAQWLIDHGATDFTQRNFQGKTALVAAEEGGHRAIADLLRRHGAQA